MVVWGKNRQGGAALWAAESRPPHSGAALLRRTSVLSQRLKTLAQAIVKHNSRPFWAAPRVRRKFGVQRRIAQGVFISPEQFNFLRYPEKRTTPYGVVLFSGGGGGSRTPVRKLFHGNFSGRRRLLRRSCSSCSPLPRQAVTPEGQVSFIIHGQRKALPAHVHH